MLVGTIPWWAFGYVPYAVYELSAVVGDGIISHVQDRVLGMLIAVSTALVTIGVESIVAGVGIKERDRRDSLTMGLIFVTMAINTACDIGIVVIVIHSMAKGMAAYGTLDNSHYEHILAKELYALIASGHHIMPYLPTPSFGDIRLYWIAKRKGPSTPCIARQKGEASLPTSDPSGQQR